MVLGAEDHPYLFVTQGLKVVERLLSGDGVIGRHLGEGQVVTGSVDQDDRQRPLAQQLVVDVGGVGLGEVAAGEDHARSMLVQQHVDVVAFPTGRSDRSRTAPA